MKDDILKYFNSDTELIALQAEDQETINKGVYHILNLKTKQLYIGGTRRWKERCSAHKCDLKHNRHENIHLQRSYNKHGVDNFEFKLLCNCPEDRLQVVEQFYIDSFEWGICII